MTFTSYTDELKATAKKLATKGKGILAVDESTPTCGKRLASIGVELISIPLRAFVSLSS